MAATTPASRGAIAMVAARLAGRLSDALLLVLLARVLSPSDFGLAAVATLCIAIATVFRDLGLTQAGVQRPTIARRHYAALLAGSLTPALLLTTGLVYASPHIASALKSEGAAPLITLAALVLPVQALSLPAMVQMQRAMEFGKLAFYQATAVVVSGVVGAGAAVFGAGAYSLVLKSIVEQVLLALLLTAHARPPLFARFSFSDLTELYSFGWRVAAAQFLEVTRHRADDVIVARTMGAASLGVYTVAYRAFRIVSETLMSAVAQVALPTFARRAGDRERLLESYYRAVRLSAILGMPTYAGLAAVAPYFVSVMFGDAWSESATIMQILAIAGIASAIRYFDSALLISVGRVRLNLRLRILTVTLTLGGFIAVAQYGSLVLFAAVVAGAAWLIGVPLWVYALHKVLDVSPGRLVRSASGPAIASACLYASVTVAGIWHLEWDAANLAIGAGLGAMVYCGVLGLVDRSAFSDIVVLARNMRPSRKSPDAGAAHEKVEVDS